jgi:hypothetical protein
VAARLSASQPTTPTITEVVEPVLVFFFLGNVTRLSLDLRKERAKRFTYVCDSTMYKKLTEPF